MESGPKLQPPCNGKYNSMSSVIVIDITFLSVKYIDLIFFLEKRIFAAADAPVDWESVDVTPVKHPDGTMGIPKAAIDSVNKNKV